MQITVNTILIYCLQIKINLLELHRRLASVEEKRDKIKNEMNNRLDPQEEREKLLLQVSHKNKLYVLSCCFASAQSIVLNRKATISQHTVGMITELFVLR